MRKKMSANDRIKEGMRFNERFVISQVRNANRQGEGWKPMLLGVPGHNAIARLRARGVIRHRKYRALSGYNKSGYWLVEKGAR